jgi:cytochrome c oxidase subunit 3
MSSSETKHGHYYLPEPSHWPILASAALFCIFFGAANWLHGVGFAPYLFGFGFMVLIYVIFGWFGTVVRENLVGLYNQQVDHSFRWGMAWFIFSEVLFFSCFFGALLYAREYSVQWIGGLGTGDMTHLLLWPDFSATWPLLHNPDPSQFLNPQAVIPAWGIPAINTLILLSSGATVTWAHWGILKNKRGHLLVGLGLTILLGISFLALQAHEYHEAYTELGLKLSSGIYGTTFFMLTGFHGLHVTIGTIMLIVMWVRGYKRHFKPDNHFAFEAVAWYWHFVDVVWLFLFVFVYWL